MRARKLLISAAAVAALGGAAAYAAHRLFFPVPRSRCRDAARWLPAGADSARPYHPMSLAWGGGALYVTEPERGAVRRYGPDGSLTAVWTGFERPVGVAPHGDRVYVTDFLTDRVRVLSTDGAPISEWGRHGAGAGEFDAPSGVAVDRQGDVYVTDLYNHRVQKFTGEGRFLLEWGGRGRGRARFRFPTGVAVTPAGQVLVADGFNQRIQRFTADGRYVGKWGGTGLGFAGKWPGWFALAKDVAVDSAGTVYVADAFNGRLQAFAPGGELLAVWGDARGGGDTLRYASGVAADPQGRVYVGDFFSGEVWQVVCPAGAASAAGPGRAAGRVP